MARGRHIVRVKPRELVAEAAEFLLDWTAEELWKAPGQFSKLTSEALFGNSRAIEVEIGSSTGEFLCALAQTAPERNFLGIEVTKRAAIEAANQLVEMNLKNVRILRANFKFLGPLLQPETWDRVYLHFPDPVHKHRDERKRIFDRGFLDQMASVLVKGGEVSVVSDKPDYLAEMLALAEKDARFERTHATRTLEFEPITKSRFQRFWERKGIRPGRFVLRKV
jgi:tRNA (guanine-N7-)-methyltransferase